jgi:ornithine cyclodeaminase/alanine dehydrogenase
VFGAGVQAETQLEALTEVRRIEAAKVFDSVKGRASQYCERMSKKLKINLKEGADARDTLRGSDIVICASTSRVPVFNGDWLEFGMHVNGVGSCTPDTRELDTVSVRRSKVIVDSRDEVLREAGDLIIPIAENAITPEHIRSELGRVILDRTKGRTSDQEITLFKSVGLAIQDVSTAQAVYKKALEQNKGSYVTI